MLQNYNYAVVLLVFLYGSILGSFFNVLILRIPENLNWISENSHCTHCKKKLKWWMNIPLVSYVLLSAKCFYCHKKISLQYPLVELLSAIKAVLLYLWLCHFDVTQVATASVAMFLFYDLMIGLLLVHVVIDYRHQILPDSINIMLLVLVIVKIFLAKDNVIDALIGGAIGFGGTFFITYLFYLTRGKIGLGGGDIKLFGIVGLMLGPYGVLQNLIASSMLGILLAIVLMIYKKKDKDQPFAFGPAIIIIFIIQMLMPDLINQFFPLLS